MNSQNQKLLINRLNRAEGQIRALRRSVNSDRKQDCKKFITQVKAARSALKSVSEQYVLMHIHSCQSLNEKDRDKQITEAIKTLTRD